MYDDHRYNTVQQMHLGTGRAAQTSVIGSRVEIDRKTMLTAVTIKDWNIQVIKGATCTGGVDYNIALSKSLGGTGAVTPFGSQALGTQADGSVLDAALTTETNLTAGDDLVLSYEAGTALPASSIKVESDVSFVEHFEA